MTEREIEILRHEQLHLHYNVNCVTSIAVGLSSVSCNGNVVSTVVSTDC